MQLLWEGERETRSKMTTMVWQTGGAPSQTVYYNGKAAESWQCYITCIFPLANTVFCLPACHSARRSVFIVCTSCVCPNQPNWVLGISLIPTEWLYFLSAHTHKYKHTLKRRCFSANTFLLWFFPAYLCALFNQPNVSNVEHCSVGPKRNRNPYFTFKMLSGYYFLNLNNKKPKWTENLVSCFRSGY